MREKELMGNIPTDEFNEVNEGYSVYKSADEYFKQEALENAQAQTVEPLQGDILSAKLCKNNNIMLFVKLPDGAKVNIFLSVAEVQSLGIPLAVSPVYSETPKGIKVITGYEVCNDPEHLKALFYGKHCLVARILNYTITEIY